MKMNTLIGKQFEMKKEVACYEGARPVTITKPVTFIGAKSNILYGSPACMTLGHYLTKNTGFMPELLFQDSNGRIYSLFYSSYLSQKKGGRKDIIAFSDKYNIVHIDF